MYAAESFATAAAVCLLATLSRGAVDGQMPAFAESARTLRVGMFEPDEAWADRIQAGALRAQAEWNAGGGTAGVVLELVRLPKTARWRDAGAQLARFILEQDLCAVIGPTSSAAAHVAAQVATRLRVPILTLCSDATLTAAKDPWIFSAVPSDLEQSRALLRRVLPRPEGARALLVVPSGRAGRPRLDALEKACAELGVEAGEIYDDQTLVLLWLDAEPARSWLDAASAVRADALILGSLRLQRRELLAAAERGTRSLLLPVLGDEPRKLGESLGYDALRSVALAAMDVGPDRDSIRAGLARLHPPTSRSSSDARGHRRGGLRCEAFGPQATPRLSSPSKRR